MRSLARGLGATPAPGDDAYPVLDALAPERVAQARHVVLIVIDGLGHGHLLDHPRGALAEHLETRMTSVFPSTTASAITTFMSGLAPMQHALTGWFVWFAEIGAVAAPLPFTTRAGELALAGNGIDARALLDARPLFARVPRACHVVQPDYLVDTAYTGAFAAGAAVHGYRTLADFYDRVAALLEAPEPSYVYAYWPKLDALAHRHGIASRDVRRHLADIDDGFARLVERARGTGSLIVLSADHGFVDTEPATRHALEDHPALADALRLPLCGDQRMAYCYVRPEAYERFAAIAAEALGETCEVRASADLVAEGWFGAGVPHPRLAGRVGDFALVMRGNHVVRDRLLGEERRHAHVGVHGSTSGREMHVPLVLAGP